ncbi:hypothetical protein EJB05_01925, partial [Eragrostis curvula]
MGFVADEASLASAKEVLRKKEQKAAVGDVAVDSEVPVVLVWLRRMRHIYGLDGFHHKANNVARNAQHVVSDSRNYNNEQ